MKEMQTRNILIRNLNVELLLGLAESSAVKFSGHFNKVIAAEQEIPFASCSWALEHKEKWLGWPNSEVCIKCQQSRMLYNESSHCSQISLVN